MDRDLAERVIESNNRIAQAFEDMTAALGRPKRIVVERDEKTGRITGAVVRPANQPITK